MKCHFLQPCEYPARIAVIDNDAVYTYGDLDRLVETFIAAFTGVRLGPVVSVCLPNNIELVAALLALLRLNTTCVLVPIKAGATVLNHIHQALHPTAWLIQDAEISTLAAVGGRVASFKGPGHCFVAIASPVGIDSEFLRPEVQEAAICKVTSSSTGLAKIIGVSANALVAESDNVAAALSLSHSDRVFVPVSMLHSYGFDLGFLASLRAGATIILGYPFAPSLLDRVASMAATVFLGTPLMYKSMLRQPSGRPALQHMRLMLSCTAPLSEATIREFNERYGVVLCQHYGTSETGALTNHTPSEVLRRPASVGRPIPGVSLRLVDEHGLEVQSGAGFLLAQSSGMGIGYLSRGMSVLRFGFSQEGFHTGDSAWFDDDGFVYLLPQERRSLTKQQYVQN